MATGKCPQCGKVPMQIAYEGISVQNLMESEGWKGVSFLCPWCRTILGVGIDPVALKTDTVAEVSDQVSRVERIATEVGLTLNRVIAYLNRKG